MKEFLDCSNCEFGSPNGSMCGVVARRIVQEMAITGYDISAEGPKSNREIIAEHIHTDPEIRKIADLECTLRLGRAQNPNQIYSEVTY